MIQFFMPMVPPTTTAQMHKVGVRNGKPYFYDPPKVAEMKAKLLAGVAQHRPQKPIQTAIRLTCKWIWPGPHGQYKPTKPDTDNLQKALKDAMTKAGFWADDALVASEICEKFTGEIPGIFVQVEALK